MGPRRRRGLRKAEEKAEQWVFAERMRLRRAALPGSWGLQAQVFLLGSASYGGHDEDQSGFGEPRSQGAG